jgi:hypothetical protein
MAAMQRDPVALTHTKTMLNRRRVIGAMACVGASMAGLALLGGCGLVPLQAPAKIPRLGYLAFATRESITEYIGALLDGLRQLGWIEGQTMTIEWRFADGHNELSPQLVADLLRLPVDLLLVTGNTPAALVARDTTSSIPIVAFPVSFPVETGLVPSLARHARRRGTGHGLDPMSRLSWAHLHSPLSSAGWLRRYTCYASTSRTER